MNKLTYPVVVAKTQRPETRTLHVIPIKMRLEKSIGIVLMMYNQLQLNAAAISSNGGKWVKVFARTFNRFRLQPTI